MKLDDIPGLFKDQDAISAILFFNKWKIMGFPHGHWGNNPNRLVEVVDLLDPLDKIYHPRSVI